ncbi:ribosome small subunit-dependent GTPase A [Amylibacter sp. SFDW26]|uniref:ribosome small subunit-dependent GTPase A n=1 Tax=Amylibacter sp. SFDW26 TaxID=2652722 RepID=UPI0012614755|nr:ribosome small subunit-dependent GTPase A [Amylibacter sp. SFDW26]KAB7613746.1 ribosome small subunit-dependent GTPase A [Amylibacter sp. SFDW26]
MVDSSLIALGWSDHFDDQITSDAFVNTPPARISDIYRKQISAYSAAGEITLDLPPSMSAGDLTVGDWILTDPETNRVLSVLDRHTLLQRQSAGAGITRQLISANVDTLMIVSSCNDDFNLARLERYLILAQSNDTQPLIVLTKIDLTDDSETYRKQAEALSPDVQAITINSKDPASLDQLSPWVQAGKTAALVGSSGVGKSTILSGLTGIKVATQGIREDDSKGRHTTTARSLRPALAGGWLIDTPGVRSLGLGESDEGLERVFSDLTEIAHGCKFSDCKHETEPKCAIRAAVDVGTLDGVRVERWKKLLKENEQNSKTIAKERERLSNLGRHSKSYAKKKRRGEDQEW